jgi:hypothetical protein
MATSRLSRDCAASVDYWSAPVNNSAPWAHATGLVSSRENMQPYFLEVDSSRCPIDSKKVVRLKSSTYIESVSTNNGRTSILRHCRRSPNLAAGHHGAWYPYLVSSVLSHIASYTYCNVRNARCRSVSTLLIHLHYRRRPLSRPS